MNVTVASASRVSADSPGFSTARRDRHPHPLDRQDDGMAGKDRTPPIVRSVGTLIVCSHVDCGVAAAITGRKATHEGGQ
jgi:hypothetical protein